MQDMIKSVFLIVAIAISSISMSQSTDTILAGYKKIPFEELNGNAYKMIDSEWMLITGGTTTKYNTMTASWGGFGCLWNLPVTYIFVKPERYTFGFLEESAMYTLTFFDHEKYKEALQICGTKSGRDGDKIKLAGLTPIQTPAGMTAFSEARIIIECRVVYSDFLDPEGIRYEKIKTWYNGKNFHKMYAGEVINCWVKE